MIIGEIRDKGGFGVVSDGEYRGNIVAVKQIKTSERDPDKIFKVLYFGQLCRSPLFKFLSAIVSRNNCLETLITSQHFTLARCIYLYQPI